MLPMRLESLCKVTDVGWKLLAFTVSENDKNNKPSSMCNSNDLKVGGVASRKYILTIKESFEVMLTKGLELVSLIAVEVMDKEVSD